MPHHLALPLRVGPGGRLATLEQDSDAEVAQSLQVLAGTRPGTRLAVPGYGVAEPAGLRAGATVDLTGAAARWEPRADADVHVNDGPHTTYSVEV